MKPGKCRTAAFFDVDRTLLKKTTSSFIITELHKRGIIRLKDILRFNYYLILHRLNLINIEKVRKTVEFLKKERKAYAEKLIKDVFDTRIKQFIPKIMIYEVKYHRKMGHMVILVSGAPEIMIHHFKDFLKADIIESTLLEIKNGVYTGKIKKLCYGSEKVRSIKSLIKSRKIDMKNSYFYSDSFSDMPMFQMVGNRIAVNPDFKLKSYAKNHGWRIIDY